MIESIRVVIDSVEDGIVTVERPDRENSTVPLTSFPSAKEGGVYDVPVRNGAPVFQDAKRNMEVEDTLKSVASERIAKLSADDPLGDLAL